MDVDIVTRAEAYILGIGARINPATVNWDDLWGRQFASREAEIAALAVEPGYFALYASTGEADTVDFVAGMASKNLGVAPEGLMLYTVPAGLYAAFPCTMATIESTWNSIYDEWLPSSGYTRDDTRPDLEYYVPGSAGSDAPVTIYMPVAPAPQQEQS